MIAKLFKIFFYPRILFFLGFLTCAASLLISFFYLEYYMEFEPCVLCWVQRGLFALLGVITLIAVLHNPKTIGWRIYSILALITTSLGVAASSRQIWLKFNPGLSGCLPTTIEDIFADNPFFNAIFTAFKGTPDCGLFQGSFLWVEITYWGFLLFTIFSCVLIYSIFRKYPVACPFTKAN